MVWFFSRNGEQLRYEIRRAAAVDAYEVEVRFPDGRVEARRTEDAADLLTRCAEIGRRLKSEGWRP
jgi:hypothetical protein